MPFLMATTPARTGVVFSLRLRAAAGPAVGAGRPAVTWLNRVALEPRFGRVLLQPYLTPRVVVRGSRRCEDDDEGPAEGLIVGLLRAAVSRCGRRNWDVRCWRWQADQHRDGSLGAIVCSSGGGGTAVESGRAGDCPSTVIEYCCPWAIESGGPNAADFFELEALAFFG